MVVHAGNTADALQDARLEIIDGLGRISSGAACETASRVAAFVNAFVNDLPEVKGE